MLQNLTNFFNLIKSRKIKTELKDNDLIAVGTRDVTWGGNYQPTAITYQDLAAQIGGGGGGSITVNGYPNINNVIITPVSSLSYDSNTQQIILGIDTDPGYKAYRAKIAVQSIDWPGYGYLYNWFAVADARKLENPAGGTGLTAPNLWRVPSETDWNNLRIFISGSVILNDATAANKLKSTLTSTGFPFYGWLNNQGGTDDYNFSTLPGGERVVSGPYSDIGLGSYFWSSTSSSSLVGVGLVIGGVLNTITSDKREGYSVRLVRNATAGELLLADGDTSDTSSLAPYTGNDGKTYVTVKIGTQIWLAQNLRETKYNDNSDIFNASAINCISGCSPADNIWQAKGTAQEGAWTAYRYFSGGILYSVEYNPTTITTFYNEVLENTLNVSPGQPSWIADSDANGPFYKLNKNGWNKTHIKVTPGYDVSDFPTINERSLLIERAVKGEFDIKFRPIKRDNTGVITIENLNNYNDLLGGVISYVYVEILEYPDSYYYSSSLAQGVGVGNL